MGRQTNLQPVEGILMSQYTMFSTSSSRRNQYSLKRTNVSILLRDSNGVLDDISKHGLTHRIRHDESRGVETDTFITNTNLAVNQDLTW